MQSPESRITNRRTVLKTAGALAPLSTVGVGGAVAAKPERKGNNFGNGNGIGAFLNEKAEYKTSPIWNEGVVDMTGHDTVEVVSGAMTSVEFPKAPFDALPVAFAPMAVKISPGTEVVWRWPPVPEGVPQIPHDVVSLEDALFDSGIRFPGDDDFTHTFDDVGTYLYYCTPHGAPFPVHPHGAPEASPSTTSSGCAARLSSRTNNYSVELTAPRSISVQVHGRTASYQPIFTVYSARLLKPITD